MPPRLGTTALGLLGFGVGTTLLAWPSTAVAEPETQPHSPDLFAPQHATSATRLEEPEVRWKERWRSTATWEYVATAGVFAGAFALRFVGPEPPDNWRGGVLFDDALDGLHLDSPKWSGHASTVSDVLYFGSMVYRLFDTVFVPGIGYDDWYLAQQLAIIDLESFALVAGTMFGSQVFVGRQRPEYERDCDGSASADELARCRQHGSRLRSFIAGHPATVLTAAGLTCTHHSRLPLYGGGWGDTMACGLMLGAAAFTGATRVWAGKHYPSDLVMGMGLGIVAGWILPRALHYGFSEEGYYDADKTKARGQAPDRVKTAKVSIRLLPWSDESRLGLQALGMF